MFNNYQILSFKVMHKIINIYKVIYYLFMTLYLYIIILKEVISILFSFFFFLSSFFLKRQNATLFIFSVFLAVGDTTLHFFSFCFLVILCCLLSLESS